jgi:hypothetical protein
VCSFFVSKNSMSEPFIKTVPEFLARRCSIILSGLRSAKEWQLTQLLSVNLFSNTAVC